MTSPIITIQNQLSQLVASPSVSSANAKWDMSNRGVIDLLANWLDDLGFAVDVQPLANNPQKANLIATLGKGPGGLVLAGHTDTVPYDENRWDSDPFKLTERDGKWHALGATDMKGFFPIALAAIASFIDKPLHQPIIVLATADEESSMDGARELMEQGKPKARFALIGEPTGLRPIRMHKGIMMEAIRVQGLSGHSSNPALGNNAMETMHLVIAALLDYRRQLQEKYHHPGFEVDVPTLNLGYIHGGDNPNRICGHCELHFDIRVLPGMPIDAMRHEINQLLEPIRRERNSPIQCEPLFAGVEAFEESSDSPLIKAVEEFSGHQSDVVGFATEAPFMKALGMDTVVYGPGSIDQAHQPNEFIALDQIEPAIRSLQQLINRFCVQAN